MVTYGGLHEDTTTLNTHQPTTAMPTTTMKLSNTPTDVRGTSTVVTFPWMA